MPTKVIMPALGMAQETGILIQWLKQEGEQVNAGEPLMEIETDKVTVEVEASASGRLVGVSAAPGDEIPVGQIIAWILAPGESVPQAGAQAATEPAITPQPGQQATTPAREIAASPLAARIAAEHMVDLSQIKTESGRISKADVLAYIENRQESGEAGRLLTVPLMDGSKEERQGNNRPVPASPKARRLAAEHGLEVATIKGSGPEGAVLTADIEEALAHRQEVAEAAVSGPQLPPIQVEEAASPAGLLASLTTSRLWRIAAERMSQSWTSAPHFYLVREVAASALVEMRSRITPAVEKRHGLKPTYTDLICKLTATALADHPQLNAGWVEGAVQINREINLGLATAIADGLIVPVIQAANTLSIGEIAAQRQALVERAHAGRLRPLEISGGTFTISNLGMYGVDAFNAIINPSQAAILAVGRIADRVVPVDGQPAVRPMMTLTLSCDHRVVDGARAAQFLADLADLIEDPWKLFA